MGGYVQMDKDLEDDPRVTAMTDRLMEHCLKLGVPEELGAVLRPLMRDASLGSLYRLWRHADTHLKSHNRLQASSHHLAEVTGLPVTVLRHLPSQWLIVHDGDTVELPNYSTKNALLNKDERRASGRERTARWRERQRAKRGVTGDTSGDTSQRHNSVTTGTGPGTYPEPVPKVKNPLSPFAGGMNGAKAPGRKPRPLRDASRHAWDRVLEAAQKGHSSVGDKQIDAAVRQMGGYGRIGQSTTEQRSENRQRFRELYEQQLEGEGHA